MTGHRRFQLWLAVITLLALLLRVWHVDFGLPSSFHPDENTKFPVILRLAHLEAPRYFAHPGLLVNSVALAVRLFHVPESYGPVILCGRLLVAFAGALTVAAIALLGNRLRGPALGLAAATLLAVSPLHTVVSRYVKEDVYLVLGLVLSTLALVETLESTEPRPCRRRALLLGLALGVAIASKFIGIAQVLLAVILLLSRKGWKWPLRLQLTGLALATAAATFLLLSPQFLLDFKTARDGIGYESRHGLGVDGNYFLWAWEFPDWGTYFFRHGLASAISWPLALAALAATALAFRKGQERPTRLLAISCILWYLIAEATPLKRQGGVERYVLPVVPFAILLAIEFTLRQPRLLRGALLIAGIGSCALHSVLIAHALKPDTREIARQWMTAHVVPGTDLRQAEFDRFHTGPRIPGARPVLIKFPHLGDDEADELAEIDCATISSGLTDRVTRFSQANRSAQGREFLRAVRDALPNSHVISRPWYERFGFHNPDIEIRWRGDVFRDTE